MNILEIQDRCLYLAKKFGFISRAVVWECISPKGRTARYKHWRALLKSPLFSHYVIGSGHPEYLILSQKGKALMGVDSVTEAPTVYLAHDEIVMRFYLHLTEAVVMENAWSEAELKMDRSLAMKCLGDGVIGKLPDLLFDLQMEGAPLRVAVEIERTRKSQGRYQTMRRAYQRAANIDVILFGVADEKIAEGIEKEISEAGLEFFGKDVGFFNLAEFIENQFEATLRIAGKEISLLSYFKGIASESPTSADFRRHGVRAELREVS